MSKFKPGDKVICVKPMDTLLLNHLYQVDRYDPLSDLVWIGGSYHGYVGYRFKLAEHLDPIKTGSYTFIEPDSLPTGFEISAAKNNLLETNINDIVAECQRAMFSWPEFNTAHEGYAVILEEVDELWDEVKKKPKNRDSAKVKAECIQIAAMALRFATEICDTKKVNN